MNPDRSFGKFSTTQMRLAERRKKINVFAVPETEGKSQMSRQIRFFVAT
jgi:hypothetical protein